jgi:hypothetical protein
MNKAIKTHETQGVEIFGASLSALISGVNEKSVRIPSGMSREERRRWAAEQVRKVATPA